MSRALDPQVREQAGAAATLLPSARQPGSKTEGPAGKPGTGRRQPIARLRRNLPSAGVAGLTFGVQLMIAARQWRDMEYGGFDLVIFDQAVRNYSHWRAPRVPLKGVYAHSGPGFLQLGDHFSPIHAAAAPLYWIWSDARILLVLQAALYALAAAVVWFIARDCLGGPAATVVGAAFGLSWGLQEATQVGYHELDWAVLIIPLAVRKLQLGKAGQACAVICVLMLVKEELGFVVATFGFLVALRGHRRLGAATAAVGLLWSALVITVVVPAIGGVHGAYWSYSSLGATPGQALGHVVAHPWQTTKMLFDTGLKRQLWVWILAAGAGTAFLSPLVLLAVPSLLLRLLSDTVSYSEVGYHYNAPLMAILFVAAVDGMARVRRRCERGTSPRAARVARSVTGGWLAAVAAVAVLGLQVYVSALPPGAHGPAFRAAARHAVTLVPPGATVEAESTLATLVSSRTPFVALAQPGTPLGSDWVLLGTGKPEVWPWSSPAQVMAARTWYLAHGYRQDWASSGVFVLQRTGPLPAGVVDVWH